VLVEGCLKRTYPPTSGINPQDPVSVVVKNDDEEIIAFKDSSPSQITVDIPAKEGGECPDPLPIASQRIEFRNHTSEMLQLFIQPEMSETPLRSGRVAATSRYSSAWGGLGQSIRVFAEATDGRKIFDQTFTWDELSQLDGLIVVNGS
jgi:hypothetical protein